MAKQSSFNNQRRGLVYRYVTLRTVPSEEGNNCIINISENMLMLKLIVNLIGQIFPRYEAAFLPNKGFRDPTWW